MENHTATLHESEQNNNSIEKSFDYKALSPEQRSVIQQYAGEIKERLRRTARDIWEIGEKLVKVRAQLKYGQFEIWLKTEFGWSKRTAYNFINVYQAFGRSTNFSRLDIATSALYRLAAPSTPKSVRKEYLHKAKKGEKITHKLIDRTLKEQKQSVVKKESQPISSPPQQILKVIPQSQLTLEVSEEQKTIIDKRSLQGLTVRETREIDLGRISSKPIMTDTPIEIKSGCWYLFDRVNTLFCGDTALDEFSQRLPDATLAIAVTSHDWDHDWLIEKASNLMLIKESYLSTEAVEEVISLFSQPGDTLIIPWLPHEEMLAIAHRLKRRIVAGDPDPERCQKAISQLGHPVKQLNL
ncbi:MAG: DUF3102 domain-containing protein [Pleurocapsa sp. MO_226.B13]|nr:DUF3102 domain-containing protein [Pleurocapsa sp. MO_226.B13]